MLQFDTRDGKVLFGLLIIINKKRKALSIQVPHGDFKEATGKGQVRGQAALRHGESSNTKGSKACGQGHRGLGDIGFAHGGLPFLRQSRSSSCPATLRTPTLYYSAAVHSTFSRIWRPSFSS